MEVESPFVQFCSVMDREAMTNEHSMQWYYTKCYQLWETKPDYIKDLLIQDGKFRAKFGLNIIASVDGEQGLGKSLFSLFWCYLLSEIFGVPFDIDKNLYVTPEDLDYGLRNSDFRTTHFLDEQRKKNVGMGAISTDLSLQDYEEQCRYTQKNIFYASPKIRDHSHYFVFTAQNIHRLTNDYCSNCPIENQKECFKKKFETDCPPEFIMLRGGEKVPFWERSGYPSRLIFLLKTKRKLDGWEVPRGFVSVPMVNPQTLMKYDKIKKKNIEKLESQEEDSFAYIRKEVQDFYKASWEKMIKLTGGITQQTFKMKDDQGRPKLETVTEDKRKYTVVNQRVIEAFLYEFLKSRRKYTTKEISIMVSMTKERLIEKAFKMNVDFFKEKEKGNI